MNRDILSGAPGAEPELFMGRKVVAVVGIDQYRSWPRLHNAVNDARGARELFLGLGFEEVVPPLLDDMATGDAIRRLVTDDLSKLKSHDRLVLFFAGHGHTHVSVFENSQPVKTGYIVPVDGDQPGGIVASWLRIDSWLSDVARLPARHILVILDACYSGVALGSLLRWRGAGGVPGHSLDSLHRRRSRRVITSALDDQRALDNGPIEGHSLFTGCLIEGLTWGLVQRGRRVATSSEIGLYVQERVTTHPGSTQTPDFGTLELDDRGELLIQLSNASPLTAASDDVPPAPTGRREPGSSDPGQHRLGTRTVRRALLLLLPLLGASIYVAAKTLPRSGTPVIPKQAGAVDVGVIRADAPPSPSRPDTIGTLDGAAAPSEAHVTATSDAGSRHEPTLAPTHDVDRPPASSSSRHVTAAMSVTAPALRDPAAILAQAEGELRNNDPRKALDIILGFEKNPSYRHDDADSHDGYRIMAMAHCQLRSIEAAEALYKLLVPQEQSRVFVYCQKLGIELVAR